MTSRRANAHGTGPSLEAVLLTRLGLPPSASAQDVEAAHDAIVEFLAEAPLDLRAWTQAQVDAADEAYALLSDPTIDRGGAGAAPIEAPVEPRAIAPRPASRPVKPGTTATPPAAPARRRVALRRVAIGAAVVVGVVAIAVGGYNLNGGPGVPGVNGSPAPEAAASGAVDPAQVSALMEKIQQNPRDVASLQALADLYYQAGDWESSRTFLQKIVAIDARNVVALLALGATDYNLNDAAAAEQQWRAVLALDENNVDAHYYLGFMYLTQEPPDTANARAEWDKVIAIAPDSEIAKSVSQHLASLSASPGPNGAGPSGSPAARPAGSPSASPAPSAAPSTAPSPAASPATSPGSGN
jgi:cytochrome c-type biogenesis protein CcmH/NrfG